MDYFQAYAPSMDDAVFAAWDSQAAEAERLPGLAPMFTRERSRIFSRFAVCYAELCALPRGARRLVQRRLARGPELGAVSPEWRRKLAGSLAGAALLLALGQGAGEAATIKVTTNVPGINAGDKKCSLIEAIINANNDNQSGSTDCVKGSGADTIALPKNTIITLPAAFDLIYNAGLPAIGSGITISGTGAKIVGGAGFRIVAVKPSGNLTLLGVSLSGASYYGDGGGVFNYGSFKIDKGTISGNTAIGSGGGVFNAGTLTITNSTVSGNQSYAGGGGIFNSGHLSIGTSTVSNNKSYAGGGLFVAAYGSAAITGSTISGNTAGMSYQYGRGGGAFLDSRATLTITNSTISGNTAAAGDYLSGLGGGVFTQSATAAITNSTISGNLAQGAGSTNYSAGNGGKGGGLFAGENYGIFYGGSVAISNSTISGNTAGSVTADAPSYGGGIFNSAAQYYNKLTLKGSLISGNSAGSAPQIANYDLTGIVEDKFNLFGSDGVPGITGLTPDASDVSGPPVTVSAILGPLAANGGTTKTHALIKLGPAIGKVITGCPATDQRGTKRPQPKKTMCDIGSFEQK